MVEYCRHCGKREVLVCACNPSCELGGHYHVDTGLHHCNASGKTFAESADPPQQQKQGLELAWQFFYDLNINGAQRTEEGARLDELLENFMTWKAGTQMEERKPDAILNFVQDMIDRAENAHESKPGICVEIPVFMADIARIKQALRTEVSESANREPQASPNLDLQMFCEQLRKALSLPDDRIWFGAGLLTVAEQLRERRDNAERALQELRAQNEQLTAFSLLQKECVIAAEEMYGTCLGAYPNSGETARTEACRKFLQLNDAVGRHPLDDKFLGMTDWKDTAASLRGLVGRMLERIKNKHRWIETSERIPRYDDLPVLVYGISGKVRIDMATRQDIAWHPIPDKSMALPDPLISEAEAAIKEPHNGETK